jgi:DedD protein
MEQKKLLLVAISVGIFLAIVIGAAILALGSGNPASSADLAAASKPRPIPAGEAGGVGQPVGEPATQGTAPRTPVDAAELLKNPEAIPGLKPAPEGAPSRQSTFYINGSPERSASRDSGASDTIITVKPKSAAGVPSKPPAGRAASRPQPPPAAAPARTAARPAQAAKPAAKAPATTKAYDDYWIQTGSFVAVARAEGVKETLASKGIASIIENREVDGITRFRVRVGPYTSQDEADYWLRLVKEIGFVDSMVWRSQSRR